MDKYYDTYILCSEIFMWFDQCIRDYIWNVVNILYFGYYLPYVARIQLVYLETWTTGQSYCQTVDKTTLETNKDSAPILRSMFTIATGQKYYSNVLTMPVSMANKGIGKNGQNGHE